MTYNSEQPRKYKRRTPFCIRPKYDDGEWNEQLKRYTIYPCRHKFCPKHWRYYAKRRVKSITRMLDANLNWYHCIIKTGIFVQKRSPAKEVSAYCKKIKRLYPGCQIVWFKHKGTKGIHYHLALGTQAIPDRQALREVWRATRPAKRKVEWTPAMFKMKQHNHPIRLVKYGAGLSYDKTANRYKRIHPPWYDLKGCVIKRYC